MLDKERYIDTLIALLKREFHSRLLYVGLQGSYLRNEVTEKSDIDIMVVLDDLSINDLALYRNIIEEIGDSDKSCGFICGKSELINWNPLEMCHLVHTTKDYYGKLTELIPMYTKEDERNFIKQSLNNLYHVLCHSYIHATKENNIEILLNSYKSVFFILQNICFQETGRFIQTQKELLSELSGVDEKVFVKALELRNNEISDFDEAFQIIFDWCKNTIQTM